jgi:hypothetical protein
MTLPLFDDDSHDPGGKVRVRLPKHWRAAAEFGGPKNCYRYKAIYRWADGPIALFGMMNPSVASEECLDMTVAKCGGFAESWGYSGFAVANACAYRSTSPAGLLSVDDPVGPRNHAAILEMAAESTQIVIAHGRLPGQLQPHADAMVRILVRAGYFLHVLRLLDDGVPSHPLARGKGFIPKTTRPTLWVTARQKNSSLGMTALRA